MDGVSALRAAGGAEGGRARVERIYDVAGARIALSLERSPSGARVTVAGCGGGGSDTAGAESSPQTSVDVESFTIGDRFVTLEVDGRVLRLPYHVESGRIRVAYRGRTFDFVPADDDEAGGETTGGFTAEITSPMPGKVLEVVASPGDTLEAESPLLLLEAMKMEQTVRTGTAAVVREIRVAVGDMVGPGEVLVVLDPPEDGVEGD